ncbi:three-helix bundle dimerization domain-containing protein [Rhodococcus sp. UFZ-B548]|uniref:three-helix bundle dimerization domain-containing protein n=1 Tax=Rhodococcus sp. UFZ-B548 TaxID=2742212 RepID=UPI0037C4FB3C
MATAHSHFAGRPVRDFIPLLVEHAAGETLAALTADQLDRTETLWSPYPMAQG